MNPVFGLKEEHTGRSRLDLPLDLIVGARLSSPHCNIFGSALIFGAVF